jgi:hypothetical protein
MSAEEHYLSKKWGNPQWDRKITTNFCKSEMFDFAESYAREYHTKEMERKLEEVDIEQIAKEYSSNYISRQQIRYCADYILTHLKEQKT